MTEYDFKPFIHYVGTNVYQVCYLNKQNRLCATAYCGRHAEEYAKEDLAKILEDLEKKQKGAERVENV